MPLDVSDSTARVLALGKQAFMANNNVAAAAGQYAAAQLWNPPGSGVNAYLDEIIPFTPLTTSYTFIVNPASAALGGAISSSLNKYVGGPNGKCQIQVLSSAAPISTAMGIYYTGQFTGGANGLYLPFPSEIQFPFVIPPGNGIILWTNTTGINMGAAFMWVEQ